MAGHKHSLEGVPEAFQLRTHLCDHGVLTLYLMDKEGTVITTASLDVEGAIDLYQDIGDQVTAFLKKNGLWAENDKGAPPSDEKVH